MEERDLMLLWVLGVMLRQMGCMETTGPTREPMERTRRR